MSDTVKLDERQDEFDRGYIEGERRAYLSLLRHIRSHFDDEGEAEKINWLVERQEAVGALRGLCAKFGDNDWPDKLYLYDVITKHLGDYLEGDDFGWGEDAPTESGYYWLRELMGVDDALRHSPVLCHVEIGPGDSGLVTFAGEGEEKALSAFDGALWWGPLGPPDEDT